MIFYATAFCQQFCWFIICEIINILFFFSREFSLPSRQNNWSLKDKTIRIVDKKPFRFVLDLVLACVLVQFIIEQNHRSNISFDTSFYKFFFLPSFLCCLFGHQTLILFYGELERNIIELLLNLLNWQRKTGCCFGVELGKWAEKFLKSLNSTSFQASSYNSQQPSRWLHPSMNPMYSKRHNAHTPRTKAA